MAFTKEGQLLVGEPAKRQAVSNPERTFTAFKRKMGTDYKYKIFGKEYRPQELSAMLLAKIKQDSEAFLGQPVKKAVITVPAYFNDNQRQATKDAGEIAGLEVVRLVNEPTAACLAYGLDKTDKDMKIMVFDLGGGTLDVTIMDFGGKVFEVKATSGDTQLGGTDMDKVLVDYLADQFAKESGIDVRKDNQAMKRIAEAAEKAKIELSTVLQTDISLPFLASDATGPKNFQHTLTRAKLEGLVRPIIDRCRQPVEQALRDAKLSPSQVEKIIMVGGPTRMPIVQKFVEDLVGKKVERGVDPMECVAMGAAIQGGVLAGEVKDILLLDVTPLSLGIETLGGVFTKLIEKNTTIPTKKSQVFSTAADNQTAVTIHVLQGEREFAEHNKSLGRFDLIGLPPAPRGIPQIEVTFDIDANGIVHVSAKDLGTGKEQSIRITSSSGLTENEIKKMQKEAEEHRSEDETRKQIVNARNTLDGLIYTLEKTLKEHDSKIEASDKKKVEDALVEAKKHVTSQNIEEIEKATEQLTQASNKMAEQMYKTSSNAPNDSGTNQGPDDLHSQKTEKSSKDKEDVIDADFKEV
ncbi:TPA: molecular chaperone DnaK [Candidatus Micrarchaeota archaeon]|nr:molecular chaperone DnaK [Candidatus Micrarchaeota archaeon]